MNSKRRFTFIKEDQDITLENEEIDQNDSDLNITQKEIEFVNQDASSKSRENLKQEDPNNEFSITQEIISITQSISDQPSKV